MALGICAAAVGPSLAQRPGANGAQNHQNNKPPNAPKPQVRQQQPRPAQRPAQPERRQNENTNRPPASNSNHAGTEARPNNNANRPPTAYTPPPRKDFNNLDTQEKRKVLENNKRLQNLPPAQRQELRERGQVWNQMTQPQRDHIKNDVLPKWRQMPPERKQAIQQRLRRLQNMPESARNQRLNDPEFTRGMSEEDKTTLRDLSHLHVGGAPDPPGE